MDSVAAGLGICVGAVHAHPKDFSYSVRDKRRRWIASLSHFSNATVVRSALAKKVILI